MKMMKLKKNDKLETPKWVYESLGPFDLDPCAGIGTSIALENLAIERNEDGLILPWSGFVFCNPPFSAKEVWIKKMIKHGSGILLLPERGSAPWFGPLAEATGKYFVMGKKINFEGGSSSNPTGSCLFPFGGNAERRIIDSGLPGHLVDVMLFKPRNSIQYFTK